MSIIEKAVNKLASDPIEPNRIAKTKETERVSQVFGAVADEADRASGHTFSKTNDLGADYSEAVETVDIDLARLRKAQLALESDDNPRLYEELRMIKRKLLVNAAGLGDSSIEKGNLIMVTSSVPDEGKTFMATNLALSIAREIDRTVLLVDADIAKSDVSKMFDLDDRKGLTDYLTDDVELNDVLLKTNIQGLEILPAGNKASNTTELIASNKMVELASRLSSQNKDRIVIFDCPPILVTSEAPILASLVGQVAFVVCAGVTKEKEFISSIERLDHSKFVGLIMNQSNEEAESGYYGYYNNT